MDRLGALMSRFTQEPLVKTLGAKLIDLREGTASVEMTVLEAHTIVGGIAQGGVTSMLADFAGVYASMTKIPEGHTPAVSLDIHFLRPVKLGETMVAKAMVINDSKSSVLTLVHVTGKDDGKLKAVATVSFKKPRT